MATSINQLGADAAGVPGIVRSDEDLDKIIADLAPEAPTDTDDDASLNLHEQDDGSVMVMPDEEEQGQDSEFNENLAEAFEESYLQKIGQDLCDAVESDKKVREERDKQYAEGIKRTGLGKEAPGGADFDGASRAVHPMLAKGCVDFASRAIKELFPAGGPCKTQIIGEATDQKIDKAERKKEYMNWQMTTQVAENRAEFERMLSQLPLGGSQYKRWWFDAGLGRPRTETVYVDDVFLPYNQSDFYTAARVTHRQYVTKEEYDKRVGCGLYRDLKLSSPPVGMQDKSESRSATDRVEGSEEDDAYDKDGLREVYQSYVGMECEEDSYTKGKIAPYIAHIDKWSGRVLGFYRNWKESDELRKKKHWMVEYNFIPWRGAYGIGLGHLIGSLAASGTGAVRAILDAAHIQNFPGGLKLAGGRNSGESVQVNATELASIAGPPGADDIRKIVMPFPFAGPSTVLFSLLEWLTQQAEGVVTTASERIADGGGADMPVGTAMALIEHDSTNFSSIHARMHHSLKAEMAILHRLNAENLTDEEVVEDLGELVVSADDFAGPVDIIPVSDPNIFSEAQRFAQMQAVMQLMNDPVIGKFLKPDRIASKMLKLLQISSPDDIANLPKDPKRLGALEENCAASGMNAEQPQPLKVYEEQDDLLHLQTHIHYMTSPIFGANPLIGQTALPVLVAHCRDHLLALYKKHTAAATNAMMAVAKMQGTELSREEAEGRGAAFADAAMAQALGPMVMPGLQAAMQAAQGMQQKPQASPDVAAKLMSDQEIAQLNDKGETDRKRLELAAEKERADADRATNAAAAQLAARMELGQQQTDGRLGEMTAQLALIRDNNNNQAKAMLTELQGQNAESLARLQAFLKAQLETMPDLTGQVMELDQRSTQVSQSLAQQLDELRTQHAKDRDTIVQLLSQLNDAVSKPKPRGKT